MLGRKVATHAPPKRMSLMGMRTGPSTCSVDWLIENPCVLEALSPGTGVGLAGGNMPAHLTGAPPCKGAVGMRGAAVRVLSAICAPHPGVAVSGPAAMLWDSRPSPAQLRLSGWPAVGPAALFSKSQRWPLPAGAQLPSPTPQENRLLSPTLDTVTGGSRRSEPLALVSWSPCHFGHLLSLCRGLERWSPF